MSGAMSAREQAAALLMREVICEKVYRERANWDPEHPNRALRVRDLRPMDLAPFVVVRILRLDKDGQRAYAASVLDILEQANDGAPAAAEAMKAVPNAVESEWCYSVDSHGEVWHSCDAAVTREEAIVEARQYAYEMGTAEVKIGWKRTYTHEDFVGGLGQDVREHIADRAHGEAGEHAEEYPDMKADPFDKALESFVLDWMTRHAPQPRFFTVEGEEEIPLT